jgi:F-type H+-transporting ATPase subunit epsilon
MAEPLGDTVAFELVAPAKLLYTGDVEMVVVPGSEGDFGVLPGHAPLISLVRPGIINIHQGGKVETQIFVAGGFAEVTQTRCTVLAEEALPVDDINRGDAESRLTAAKAQVEAAENAFDKAAAQRELGIAEALLAAAG